MLINHINKLSYFDSLVYDSIAHRRETVVVAIEGNAESRQSRINV